MKVSRPKRIQRRAGFTLLEVLLVLAIIIVMLAMIAPNLLGRQQKANEDLTRVGIKNFEDAVKMYAVDHDGQYPKGTTEEVLSMLMSDVDERTNKPRSPYLDEPPTDAWKNTLNYEYPPSGNRSTPGNKPAIWSNGLDAQEGTEDDIDNWTRDEIN